MNTENTNLDVDIRPMVQDDLKPLCTLLDVYSNRGLLLKRTPENLLASMRSISIAVHHGKIAGCVSLKDYGGNLFEIRSLAVDEHFQGQGIGSCLVAFKLEELSGIPGARCFALTYHPNLFSRLGFEITSKESFPEKIWADCAICPHLLDCHEIAVLKCL